VASTIFDPLEGEEALAFGEMEVLIVYAHRKPVRIKVLKKSPMWTPQDVKKADTLIRS